MTTPQQTRSDAGLATALRISVSRLARRLRAERLAKGLEPGLSDTQLAALASLERHSTMTPGELADHEKVQPPSMTRVIAALEERGLVMRAPHATDRRQVVLTVTDHGREVVQQVAQAARGVAGEATARADSAGAGDAAGGGADTGEAQPVLTGRPGGGKQDVRLPETSARSDRNYRLFAAGQVVSNTGSWMQRVAQDWLVLELTHNSGTALGITTGLQFLPLLLFSLWGGVIADRYSKRGILMVTQTVMGGLALILGVLALTGSVRIWQVYLLAFALGLVTVVDNPDPAGLRRRDGRPGRNGQRHRAEQRRLQPGQDRRPAVAGLVIGAARDAGGVPGERGLLRRRADRAQADAPRRAASGAAGASVGRVSCARRCPTCAPGRRCGCR